VRPALISRIPFMPRVLHVSESDEWSGGAAQLLALAEGLRAKGWDVRVGCRRGSGLDEHARERSFPTTYAAMKEDYDLLSAWTLADYFSREGVDVVHAHHNRSHAVCLLAKSLLRMRFKDAPVLVVSRRVSFAPGKNPFSMWKYRSGFIDRIVAVAEAVKEVLVASGVPAARVSVIHSGVDTGRFLPKAPTPEFRAALGAPAGVPIVGKIANASPWKGQKIFLEAAAKTLATGRKAHFLLAGRDTDAEWVRAEVATLKLEGKVSLLGFRTDVPDILSCLSVSVNAAVKGEGLSGALRESLTMGVPVVASDMAGNRELIATGAGGYLYKPGDAAALAERLCWVLDHGEEARASARKWRETVLPEFSTARMIEKTDALYRELLSTR
jgi:glycosyltransferase involved in cell wall biosynthesis